MKKSIILICLIGFLLVSATVVFGQDYHEYFILVPETSIHNSDITYVEPYVYPASYAYCDRVYNWCIFADDGDGPYDYRTYSFSSSNPNVATVDDMGMIHYRKTGGTTTITALYKDDGTSGSFDFCVDPMPEKERPEGKTSAVRIGVTIGMGVELGYQFSEIHLDGSVLPYEYHPGYRYYLNGYPGYSCSVGFDSCPSKIVEVHSEDKSGAFHFESSDPKIVSVAPDGTFLVKKTGSVRINACPINNDENCAWVDVIVED